MNLLAAYMPSTRLPYTGRLEYSSPSPSPAPRLADPPRGAASPRNGLACRLPATVPGDGYEKVLKYETELPIESRASHHILRVPARAVPHIPVVAVLPRTQHQHRLQQLDTHHRARNPAPARIGIRRERAASTCRSGTLCGQQLVARAHAVGVIMVRGAPAVPPARAALLFCVVLPALAVFVRFFCRQHKAAPAAGVGAEVGAGAARTEEEEEEEEDGRRGLLSAVWDEAVRVV
ncbi:hypothetical protein BJY52DRAFT_1210243 [Lactarius psammicola]|nr:hypothetical protein BJY52DRAFT_1210243 [Lactarius psammicola]